MDWVEESDILFDKRGFWEDANPKMCQWLRPYVIREGYKRAADILIDYAEKQDNWLTHSKDILIYPIIFNHRHYLEFAMKAIIANYGDLTDIEPCWNTHDLNLLVDKIKDILEYYDPGQGDDIKKIIEHINNFNRIDPKSDGYRYHIDRKGSPIQEKLESFNLGNLKRVMNTIYNYLDSLDSFLDASKQDAGF